MQHQAGVEERIALVLRGSRTENQRGNNRTPPAFRGMPRYFFHVRRGRAVSIDKVGVELASLAEAIEEAERRGREIAVREATSAVVSEPGMIIFDEDWRTVLALPLE
jgi:hypothetical protein